MKTTKNRGSALLLVLIAVFILSLIGLSALTQSGSEINTAGNFLMDKSTFYAADAGSQVCIGEVKKKFINPKDVILDNVKFGKQKYFTGTIHDTKPQNVKAFLGFRPPPVVGQSADMGGDLNIENIPWLINVTAVSKAGTRNQIRKQVQILMPTMATGY
jgi:hypothetical protein